MRISDWSSDVCSSDLGQAVGGARKAAGAPTVAGDDEDFVATGAQKGGGDPIMAFLAPSEAVADRVAVDEAHVEVVADTDGKRRPEGRRDGKEGVSTCLSR